MTDGIGQASHLRPARSVSVGYWLARGMVQVTQTWSPWWRLCGPGRWCPPPGGRHRGRRVLGAVAEADLQLAGQDDDKLAARGRVPVGEAAGRGFAEADGGRCLGALPIRRLVQFDSLNVGLAVIARVKSEGSHRVPRFGLWGYGWSVGDAVRPRLQAAGPRPWR